MAAFFTTCCGSWPASDTDEKRGGAEAPPLPLRPSASPGDALDVHVVSDHSAQDRSRGSADDSALQAIFLAAGDGSDRGTRDRADGGVTLGVLDDSFPATRAFVNRAR